MNIKTIAAALLILFGGVILACSGLSFTTPGKPVEFPGIRIETTVRNFISPAVGLAVLGCGIALLFIKRQGA